MKEVMPGLTLPVRAPFDIYAPIAQDLAAVERILAGTLETSRPGMGPLLQHLRHFRGKRLRPALLLLTARACGAVQPAHHLLAAVVEMIHTATLVHDDVLDENGTIDPHKIDLVARMGGDYYCRASGGAVFKVPKPNMQLGIGVDALPQSIRQSHVLTGNNLGLLGNSTALPIVGEPLYTKGSSLPLLTAPRVLLHAAHLSFEHPAHHGHLSFDEPLPPSFQNFLDAQRRRGA